MEWFHKHLNWTTLFITIFACSFGILLVNFSLDIAGYDYLPVPGNKYVEIVPWSTYNPFTFTYQAMADVAIIVSMPVFYWVLKRKNRSLWYLIFFLPPIIPVPSAGFVLLFLMPFWLAGWVILLKLTNRTARLI